jgi:hypothetical protein
MKNFTEYLFGDINESKTTFELPLIWDKEVAKISYEPEADSDNYTITVDTPVGTASYYVDVEDDGEIKQVKGANALALVVNNFILLEKKKQNI